MKYYFLILMLIGSPLVYAQEFESEIDVKYREINIDAYAKFNQAREILDSWVGEKQDLVVAIKLLEEVNSMESEFAPAYRELGRYYIMSGFTKFEEAIQNPSEYWILESIEIEPQYADSYSLLGHLYTTAGKFDEAEEALNIAEKIGTSSPWLDLNWADLLVKKGNFDVAFRKYNGVLERGTFNKKAYSKALSGVTNHYVRKKDSENARKSFVREIDYDPNSAWKWGNYASFLLYVDGDVSGAIENAEKALSIMEYPLARKTLATALITKWHEALGTEYLEAEAEIYLSSALEIYPYPDDIIGTAFQYENTRYAAMAFSEWYSAQKYIFKHEEKIKINSNYVENFQNIGDKLSFIISKEIDNFVSDNKPSYDRKNMEYGVIWKIEEGDVYGAKNYFLIFSLKSATRIGGNLAYRALIDYAIVSINKNVENEFVLQ